MKCLPIFTAMVPERGPWLCAREKTAGMPWCRALYALALLYTEVVKRERRRDVVNKQAVVQQMKPIRSLILPQPVLVDFNVRWRRQYVCVHRLASKAIQRPLCYVCCDVKLSFEKLVFQKKLLLQKTTWCSFIEVCLYQLLNRKRFLGTSFCDGAPRVPSIFW